jgi:hypothetical protein
LVDHLKKILLDYQERVNAEFKALFSHRFSHEISPPASQETGFILRFYVMRHALCAMRIHASFEMTQGLKWLDAGDYIM